MSLPHDLSDLCQCVCAQSEDKKSKRKDFLCEAASLTAERSTEGDPPAVDPPVMTLT